MLDVEAKFISVLTTDATLNAVVPTTNIMVGPVDIVQEKRVSLVMPQINIFMIGESVRTVPLAVRDTVLQLDIWSRNSQLEVENIYERVLTLLDFLSTSANTSYIFWQRLGTANDQYESDVRIWHRSCRFSIWCSP